MHKQTSAAAAPSWGARLAPYRHPDLKRSLWQLTSTSVAFVAGWVLMYYSLALPYWVTLLLAAPTALLLVRLFIFQHDLGHGSFLKSQRVADGIGTVLGIFTLTPYLYWKRTHAIHHATSGNLEHRGFGDINTLTVSEYLALGSWGRFKYRVYRNPIVLFVIGPPLHFLVKHRLPMIVPAGWTRERRSILVNDAGLAVFVIGMMWSIGVGPFLAIYLPIALTSCAVGVWLFYVQHQYERTYWEHESVWSFNTAALEGSSYYHLPKVFQWFTGNIGIHHIHHLHASIPNYFLRRAFDELPELQKVNRLTFSRSLRCIPLALWDENGRQLVSFRAARRLAVS
ncbi:MAG: fatty acid desaturase [Acidobacteriota bacterium]